MLNFGAKEIHDSRLCENTDRRARRRRSGRRAQEARAGAVFREVASEPRPSAPSQEALGSLADITAAVEQSIGRMVRRPAKVEMEFSASLSAECDRWIASGDGEAEFKVTLAWGEGE